MTPAISSRPLLLIILASGSMACAQTTPSLTSQWSPGAIPGGGVIQVAVYPVVADQPFTAENNSRSVQTRNGQTFVYEAHSLVARDVDGRVATRTEPSPRVPNPDGRGASDMSGGGGIADPVAGVRMNWVKGGPPPMPGVFTPTDGVVMRSRLEPGPEPPPLDPCERKSGKTRNYPNGDTQKIEELGERVIQNVRVRGCRVITYSAPRVGTNQPTTGTDEWWSSPQLRITLLRLHHDPTRDETQELDNIVLGQPDHTLFLPPADNTVRDMGEGIGSRPFRRVG